MLNPKACLINLCKEAYNCEECKQWPGLSYCLGATMTPSTSRVNGLLRISGFGFCVLPLPAEEHGLLLVHIPEERIL